MSFQPATLKEDGAGAGEAAGEKATSPTQNLEDEEDSEEGEEEDDEEALAEKFSEAFNQIDIDSGSAPLNNPSVTPSLAMICRTSYRSARTPRPRAPPPS